ncbi:MAG TPA: NAD(P)/FAD-dependent oxidoreductase [Hyphomicrobiaceae bacterium]|nr:NAD(P)/FAD-dependent oxidoreductase [Hyphomicrobiaceae bacterium]
MKHPDRRQFGLGLGAVAVAGASLYGAPAVAQARPRVVIIGGGPGGATVANQLAQAGTNIEITLIEVQPQYTTCFFSNLYLGGFRTFRSITHNYNGLKRRGVKAVAELATDVDTAKKTVRTRSGTHSYDRLVVSPGIDLKYDSIEGYSRQAAQIMPHAYQAGTQTTLLKSQLERMRDGGVVVMAPPNNPYRCPPGPYERACMIAHFLKTRKPKSKLVILDPKRSFSKQPVFMEAFEKYYKANLELNLSTELDDFTVVKVDTKAMTVTTKGGKTVKADVANIIPNQRAGEIAHKAGLADGDWCPINPENFTSRKVEGVYVLGDASIAAEMPKSAFSANSQAKVVAAEILADLASKPRFPATFRNTCWSMVAPDDSIKVGANYAPKGGKLVPSGEFVSKPGEDAATHKANYQESLGWYSGIVSDIFATDAPAVGPKKKS